MFTSMRASSGSRITIASGQGHIVIVIGNVAIKLPFGEIQMIENVLYSPGIVKNLLSVYFLASRGLSFEFKEQICTIKNATSDLITTTMRELESGLYKLLGETLAQCFETLLTEFQQSKPLSMTWRRYLGHTYFYRLYRLIQYGAVKGSLTS